MAPHLSLPLSFSLFLSLVLYLVGFLLYIILITIIIYRLSFFPLNAEEFTPTYWIDMGAAAISTVAGATTRTTLPAAKRRPRRSERTRVRIAGPLHA